FLTRPLRPFKSADDRRLAHGAHIDGGVERPAKRIHRTIEEEGRMNEAKLHEFMGKVVTDMGGAWMMAMVLIGDELGLYKAMGDGKATTAETLAERCGCHPRLVRAGADANAASGYLEVAGGAYRLPPEQAMALANQDSPVFVAPGQSVVASCFMDLDKVLH